MGLARLLPPPGRSRWWFIGAFLFGFALPGALAALLMVAGYYPIGRALPPSVFWTEFGPVLAIWGAAVIILVAAPLYSLFAWSWRPLLLAAVIGFGGLLGFVPGMIGGEYVRDWAFDLFSGRSATVVEAIANHVRMTGMPPATLAELRPDYLTTIPGTGMAQAPEYAYEAEPGPCSFKNKWHLSVLVRDFLSVHRLLYCPEQDTTMVEDAGARTRFGNWLYELIDS
jgi:hypothetical protein